MVSILLVLLTVAHAHLAHARPSPGAAATGGYRPYPPRASPITARSIRIRARRPVPSCRPGPSPCAESRTSSSTRVTRSSRSRSRRGGRPPPRTPVMCCKCSPTACSSRSTIACARPTGSSATPRAMSWCPTQPKRNGGCAPSCGRCSTRNGPGRSSIAAIDSRGAAPPAASTIVAAKPCGHRDRRRAIMGGRETDAPYG